LDHHRRAGGRITRLDGSDDWTPDGDGNFSALASNGAFHDELVRMLTA
jgi:fructose-1,6-bisphosphatase/inositol monophosphatase family enzyme